MKGGSLIMIYCLITVFLYKHKLKAFDDLVNTKQHVKNNAGFISGHRQRAAVRLGAQRGPKKISDRQAIGRPCFIPCVYWFDYNPWSMLRQPMKSIQGTLQIHCNYRVWWLEDCLIPLVGLKRIMYHPMLCLIVCLTRLCYFNCNSPFTWNERSLRKCY